MPKAVFSGEAERDLAGIYLYTLTAFGFAQAEAYVADLKKACDDLAATPGIGRLTESLMPDIRRHAHAGHIIFYRSLGADIFIARILGRRTYWQRYLDTPNPDAA